MCHPFLALLSLAKGHGIVLRIPRQDLTYLLFIFSDDLVAGVYFFTLSHVQQVDSLSTLSQESRWGQRTGGFSSMLQLQKDAARTISEHGKLMTMPQLWNSMRSAIGL